MRFHPSNEITVYLDEGILCTTVDLFLAQVICYADDLLLMRSCDDPPHLERHNGPGAAEIVLTMLAPLIIEEINTHLI
jgi:hypothetical protein